MEGQGFVLLQRPADKAGLGPVEAQGQHGIKCEHGNKDLDDEYELLHASIGGGVQQRPQYPGYHQCDGDDQQGECQGEGETQPVPLVKGPEEGPGGGFFLVICHDLSSSVFFQTPPRSKGFSVPPMLNR